MTYPRGSSVSYGHVEEGMPDRGGEGVGKMADVGAQRTDSPLIKHLARTMGLKAAEAYNGLPLFVMPDEADELDRT